MANPNWKRGAASPNPQGRRKYKNSSTTIRGKVERFLKSKLTPKELNLIYDGLNAKDKAELLTELLPFVVPKQSAASLDLNIDKLNDQEVETMYMQLFNQVNRKLSIEGIPEAEVIPMPETIQLPIPEKLPNN